jgi:hypothetical protein
VELLNHRRRTYVAIRWALYEKGFIKQLLYISGNNPISIIRIVAKVDIGTQLVSVVKLDNITCHSFYMTLIHDVQMIPVLMEISSD